MNINTTMRRSTPQIRIMIVAPLSGSWNIGERLNKVQQFCLRVITSPTSFSFHVAIVVLYYDSSIASLSGPISISFFFSNYLICQSQM